MDCPRRQKMMKAERHESPRIIPEPAMIRWDSIGGNYKLAKVLNKRISEQCRGIDGCGSGDDQNDEDRRRALLSGVFSTRMSSKDTASVYNVASKNMNIKKEGTIRKKPTITPPTTTVANKNEEEVLLLKRNNNISRRQAIKRVPSKKNRREEIKRIPSKKNRRDAFRQTRRQTALRNLDFDNTSFDFDSDYFDHSQQQQQQQQQQESDNDHPTPVKMGVPQLDKYGRYRRCFSSAISHNHHHHHQGSGRNANNTTTTTGCGRLGSRMTPQQRRRRQQLRKQQQQHAFVYIS